MLDAPAVIVQFVSQWVRRVLGLGQPLSGGRALAHAIAPASPLTLPPPLKLFSTAALWRQHPQADWFYMNAPDALGLLVF